MTKKANNRKKLTDKWRTPTALQTLSTAKLEAIRQKVEKIAKSNTPINPMYWDRHAERVELAKEYDYIFEGVITEIAGVNGKRYRVKSISSFKKMIQAADSANYCCDSKYIKVAEIKNFPEPKFYIIWFLSPNSL